MELLVVIAIIGVLASVVLASLNSSRVKSRNAATLSQMYEYQKALQLYYHENDGVYPHHPVAGLQSRRVCFGDGMATLGPGGNGDCMGTVSDPYSQAVADLVNNALGTYLSSIPTFKHANGYASPAFNSCITTQVPPIPTSNTDCGPQYFSIFFALEGTNQDCGKATLVNVDQSGSGNTICRLMLQP